MQIFLQNLAAKKKTKDTFEKKRQLTNREVTDVGKDSIIDRMRRSIR